MKVLLVNPPVTFNVVDYYEDTGWSPPLGLAYLAGAAIEAGHEVTIVDCLGLYPVPAEVKGEWIRVGMPVAEIMERVRDFAPDLVGVSCPYTANAPDSIEIARLIKEEYSAGVPVIMGGAHASTCPEDVFASGYVDHIAIGEGEETLVELCVAIQNGSATDSILGLLTRSAEGRLAGGGPRPRIRDLDAIPLPRRDLLPMNAYIEFQKHHTERINYMRTPSTTMITSRGCPEKCVFCAIRCTWGRLWVGRSAENVVDEIEHLVNEYGIREIHFQDDSVSVSRKRLREICELLIERKIDVKWQPASGIAIWTLDEDLLKLMKKAGCYRLTLGVETGNPETLAFVRKRYTYEHALKIIKTANRLGMWTIGTLILGFPYETREQMEDSIRFATDSGLDFAFFFCAAPFPGTDLYEVCMAEGIEVPVHTSVAFGVVDSVTMTAAQIEAVRQEATARLVKSITRRPWKLLWKVRSLEDLRYTMRVALYSLKLMRRKTEGKSITAFLYGDAEEG